MQGIYPTFLEIAEVIPMYKKIKANLAANDRLISILSQFDKIFEKMLYSRIFLYLKKCNLFTNRQFGF